MSVLAAYSIGVLKTINYIEVLKYLFATNGNGTSFVLSARKVSTGTIRKHIAHG